MTHDLVVRGGTVVDGTGGPERTADVAIDGGLITAVGQIAAAGRTEIDADGLIVTPGFVDIHTHMDAQIGWDPLGSSSCWHGVTSVVLGNCGMTFAPVRPGQAATLAEMMESVEDIPAAAILDGLSWEWETYGEYLGALEQLPRAIHVGGMVGHAALRWYAMGDRCLEAEAVPTDDELAVMTGLLAEGMAAGALGFSTSRTLRHTVPDGRHVPGTFADAHELGAFGEVLRRAGAGVIELAPRFDGEGPSEPRARSEIGWMRQISIDSGRPVTFNLTHTWANPEHHRLAMQLCRDANAAGADLRPQTTTRGIGVLFSLSNMTPFDRHPAWQALKGLTLAQKLDVLRDPTGRQRLADEARLTPVAHDLAGFYLADRPGGHAGYDCDPVTELPAVIAASGVDPVDWYLDALLASDGATIIYWPILNQSLDAIEEMIDEDLVVLGLADGGAHVGQILDASQPTWFLTHWIRDRGVASRSRAIQRLSSDGANLFGLAGRGLLAPGMVADVNIIDWEALALPLPRFVHDFPHGAGRYIQGAEGYRHTIVAGVPTFADGVHTGEFAGQVLRSRGSSTLSGI